MLENIILGMIQGVVEWLPISSEGVLVLVQTRFFGSEKPIIELIQQALFLHLGTVLAVIVYFWKDVWQLLKVPFIVGKKSEANQKIFGFVLITALITGLLGYALLGLLSEFEKQVALTGRIITGVVGLMLLITACFQLKAKREGKRLRRTEEINRQDSFILGILQALAVLPGMSRSGMTVSGLLLRKFDEQVALQLSFLMSLPVIIAGNLFLNFKYLSYQLSLSWEILWGLLFSFVFGLLTIDLFLRLAKRMNFGWFVLFFGILVLVLAVV